MPQTTGWPQPPRFPAQSSHVQASTVSQKKREERGDWMSQDRKRPRAGKGPWASVTRVFISSLPSRGSACFTRNSCENRYPRPLKGRAGTIKAAPGVQLGSHQLWTNRSWTPAPETGKKTGGGSSEIPALPHPWARRVRLGNSEAFLTLVPLLQTPLAPRLPTRTTTIHPTEKDHSICVTTRTWPCM